MRTTGLDISTDFTTAQETGNQVTGDVTSGSETDNSSDSSSATETNQTLTAVTSSTTLASDTSLRSGNAITGSFSLSDSSSSTVTNYENDTNQTDTAAATASDSDDTTGSGTENEVTGGYTQSEEGTSGGTLTSMDWNQSQTVSISQFDGGTTSAGSVGNNVTGASSGTSYDTDTTSVFPAETNTGDLVGPPALGVTATETDVSTDSTTFSANDITGLGATSSHATDTLGRPENIDDGGDDSSGNKYSLTTVDSFETANSVTGSYNLSETTNQSFSNYDTNSDGSLASTVTELGMSSDQSAKSGNSILGSFTLSETSNSTATTYENDSVGGVTTSATSGARDYSTVSSWGNDVTGAESTSQSDNSSATMEKSDSYGGGDVDAQTITSSGSDGSWGSQNAITGAFSFAETSSGGSTTIDKGTLSANGFSVSEMVDTSSGSGSEYGNAVTGALTTSQTTTDSTTLAESGANSSGFRPYTLSQQDLSTVTVQASENTITGDTLQTTYAIETTSIGQYDFSSGGGTGAAVYVSYAELTSSGSTATETGDTITGVYASSTDERDTSTFTESGTNAAGTVSVSSTSSQTPMISESGNTLTGGYTFSESATQDYSFMEKDTAAWSSGSGTAGPESWSLMETGAKAYSLTQSGSHVTGNYTLSEHGSDAYTINQTGGAPSSGGGGSGGGYGSEGGGGSSGGGGGGGGTTWGVALSGTDNYTTNETGNELSGAFSLTTSGSGSGSLDETGALAGTDYDATPTIAYVVHESGNHLAGALSLTETGSDRYSLLPAFTNVSNVLSSNGPGDVDYSPVGAPYQIGVSPYWGHGPVGDLAANASDAAFNQLGLDLLHQYCFPSGVEIHVDGQWQGVETVRRGQTVSAVDEADAERGQIAAKEVKDRFDNDPARLWHVYINGALIRVTERHTFLVLGKGFVAAAKLQIGDRLRSHDGQPAVVTAVSMSDEIEPVYNVHVADFHTFFVRTADGRVGVLVHNDSPAPEGQWTEAGVINEYRRMYGDDQRAMLGMMAILSKYKLATGNFWSDDYAVDHKKGVIYIAATQWFGSARGDTNAADQLHQLLGNEFGDITGMPATWGEEFRYRGSGVLKMGGGVGSIFGGLGLLAAPEPTMLSKVAGVSALGAGGSVFIEGGTQALRIGPKGGFNPITEALGSYGKWMAGEEGEASARQWANFSQFFATLAGGLSNTRLANLPMRQLPQATKEALQASYNNLRQGFAPTATNADDVVAPANGRWNIWDNWDPKIRGRAIEKLLGRNLPKDFPGVDRFDAEGLATSIKSMNLADKSYQKASYLRATLNGYLNDLKNFEGAVFDGVRILKSDITLKELKIAVPPSLRYRPTAGQIQVIEQFKQSAEASGIRVVIVEVNG